MKPGYKQTEVGVIPEDWNLVPCSELCVKIQDGTHFSPKPGGADYLYITSRNIRFGFMDFSSASRIDSKQHLTIYKRCDVKKGDLLLTKDGANTGNAALNYLDEEFSLLSSVAFLRFNRRNVASYFLQQLLSTSGQRQIQDAMAGNAITRLTLAKIRKLRFPAPPAKTEQEAIAEALSDADALIESLEQLIIKKRHLKQGAMQELFKHKSHDQVRLLSEVSSLKGRIGWQGLKQTEFTANEREPFLITGMNFKDGDIRWNEVYHIAEARYEMAKDIQLRTGDVLMTKDGTIGKVLYIESVPFPGKASLNSHLLLFRPIRQSYYPKYLYYQLGSKRFADFIEFRKSGTTFFGISQAAVGNYPVLLPSMEEQIRISTILTDMDAEIATLEAKLDKAREIKQGMMQELLTGRIRLISPVGKRSYIQSSFAENKKHNWQINEAVIIGVLANHFGEEKFPLTRKRCTKLTYLLHR